MPEKRFMAMAIEEAHDGIKADHGGPFGAAVVKNGRVLAVAHNTVLRDNDPTRHAEIKALSGAAKELGTFDLSGCDIYSTTEPCPMCFSAVHWARVSRLIYGTDIGDVIELGFHEMPIPVSEMKDRGGSEVEIISGFMRGECEELLRFWEASPGKRVY